MTEKDIQISDKNEPVAWIGMDDRGFVYGVCTASDKKESEFYKTKFTIPLYTAPQTKPLSNEEINDIIQKLNQSRISWSGNQFIKEAIKQAEERHGIK